MKKQILLTIMLLALLTGLASAHYSILDLAGMHAANGNEKAALDAYAQAIALEPSSIKAYEARAFYYLKLNRTREALADFTALLAIAPSYGAGYVSRGLVYSQLEDRQRATADFAAACALGDPSGCSFAAGK
jgi:tetratricopeptide (TPR) repeat protein